MTDVDNLRLLAEDKQVAARIDRAGRGPRASQRLDRAVDGIAFGDSVQADGEWPAQPHTAAVEQLEVGECAVPSGRCDAVEQPAGRGVNLLRAFENLPGPVID